MREKKSIFETLDKMNKPYSVGISKVKLRNKSADLAARSYFLITERKDYPKSFGSRNSSAGYKYIERDLNKREIKEFRENQDKFILTVDNMHGKIFELKNNSLRNQ